MLSVHKALHYTGSLLSVVGGVALYFAVLYGIYQLFVGSALHGLAVIGITIAAAYIVQSLYAFLCPQP